MLNVDTVVCSVPHRTVLIEDESIFIDPSAQSIRLNKHETEIVSYLFTPKSIHECAWDLSRKQLSHKHVMLANGLCNNLLPLFHKKCAEYSGSYELYIKLIAHLIDVGVIVCVTSLLKPIYSHAYDITSKDHNISSLCIPSTFNDSIYECVKTFSDNFAYHNKTDVQILIVEDRVVHSRNYIDTMRLERLYSGPHNSLKIVDIYERDKYAQDLCNSGVAPKEIINFGINPDRLYRTIGATRNVIMLMTSGQLIIQTDDDTQGVVTSTEHDGDTIKISNDLDPYFTNIIASHAIANSSEHATKTVDILSIHEAVLNHNILDIVGTYKSVHWHNISPSQFIERAYSDMPSVNVSSTGFCGDAGMNSPYGLLVYSPLESLKKIYNSEKNFNEASRNRYVKRYVEYTTLNVSSALQTMSCGFNNTVLLPPFFPYGRNTDGAFASYLYALERSSIIAHLPYAIRHEPSYERRYINSPENAVRQIGLTDIVQMCLLTLINNEFLPIEKSIVIAGEQLTEIGSLSNKSFISYIQKVFIVSRKQHIHQLYKVLRNISECSWNKGETIISWIDRINQSIIQPDAIRPLEIPSSLSIEQTYLEIRRYLLMYGKLLIYWKAIHEAAKEINRKYIWSK